MTQLRNLCVAGLALASVDCTVMYADDIDAKQCSTNDDCAERGEGLTCAAGVCTSDVPSGTVSCETTRDCPGAQLCGFDGLCYDKWGCLADDPDWPTAASEFTFSAPLVSIVNPEDPSLLGNDIEVLACSGADLNCASPIAEGAVNAQKQLSITFEDFTGAQFGGVIRIRDTGATAEQPAKFLPTYIHYGYESRLVGDLPVQSRVFLVDPASYAGLASLTGAEADPDAGTVIFVVQDCGGRTASQVTMRAEDTTGTYFVAVQGGSQPIQGATSTGEDGGGIILNVPPDRARTFVLGDEASGREIARVAINVRGSATNYVYYYPRYAALKRWLDEYERTND